MKKFSRILAIFAVVFLVVGLAGCSDPSNPGASGTTQGGTNQGGSSSSGGVTLISNESELVSFLRGSAGTQGRLTADIRTSGENKEVTVPAGKTLALNLDTYEARIAITVEGNLSIGGSLTVTDTGLRKYGTLRCGTGGTYTIKVPAGGVFNLKSGRVSADSSACTSSIQGIGGTIKITNGLASGKCAILVDNGSTLEVTGGIVQGSSDNAIKEFYDSSRDTTNTIKISGGIVVSGTDSDIWNYLRVDKINLNCQHEAITITRGGTKEITGGAIYGWTGIKVSSTGVVSKIENVHIYAVTCVDNSGTITEIGGSGTTYFEADQRNVSNNQMSSPTAPITNQSTGTIGNIKGGTFYAYGRSTTAKGLENRGTVTITGGLFHGYGAEALGVYGYGLYNNNGTVTIKGGSFEAQAPKTAINGTSRNQFNRNFGGTVNLLSSLSPDEVFIGAELTNESGGTLNLIDE